MSFEIALSGIKAANSLLNSHGNNIANASTTGFKQSRVQFSDVYASSALGAGTLSVGTGVRLSGVLQQFSQGTISFTNNNLDLAISGQGFFQLLDSAGVTTYTRAGAFQLDRAGNIVSSASDNLRGFLADSQGNLTGAVGNLVVDTSNFSPKATTDADFTVNLNSADTAPGSAWVSASTIGAAAPSATTFNNATSTTIYDSLGNSHIMTAYFMKTATANQWEARFRVDNVDVGSVANTPRAFDVNFTSSGAYILPTAASTPSDTISLVWAPLSSTGTANGATTPQTFSVTLGDTSSGSTQLGSPFAVNAITQDGYTTGRLNNIDVDSTGVFYGRFTNGQSRALGQVALANFSNVQGLRPVGDTAWAGTFTSGDPVVGAPSTASLGSITSGALEDSNVDLTDELVQLITAQRNFQANAQTIRTADAVTQTIINLR